MFFWQTDKIKFFMMKPQIYFSPGIFVWGRSKLFLKEGMPTCFFPGRAWQVCQSISGLHADEHGLFFCILFLVLLLPLPVVMANLQLCAYLHYTDYRFQSTEF